MKKTGIIILCRYNSTRLPGKILKEIDGQPVLQHIVNKIRQVVPQENIIIATSEEKTDTPIVEYCHQTGLNYYRGSLNNVSLRFLEAAQNNRLDFAVRINGDNFFVNYPLLDEMINIAVTNDYDFVSNVKGRTFPKGMSIEIVKTQFYKQMYSQFESEGDFEHVTIYLYHNDEKIPNKKYIYNRSVPEAAGIQLSIDTQEDFDRTIYIYSRLKNKDIFDLKEIYKLYKEFYQNHTQS